MAWRDSLIFWQALHSCSTRPAVHRQEEVLMCKTKPAQQHPESARVAVHKWLLEVPACKCGISFCLLGEDRLHQPCWVWSTSSLQVRIPSWGSVPCPTVPCAFGLCCVGRVGVLQHLFGVHYQVWCHCVKESNSIILLSSKTGESIAVLRVFEDALMCWRRYRDLEPVAFWGLPSGDRWELKIILSHTAWFQILFSLLLTLQLPRDIYRFWVQVSMFC